MQIFLNGEPLALAEIFRNSQYKTIEKLTRAKFNTNFMLVHAHLDSSNG